MALTQKARNRIERPQIRALARMTEPEFDRWCATVNEYTAAGYVADVASAKALTDVFGDDRWTRFRVDVLAGSP